MKIILVFFVCWLTGVYAYGQDTLVTWSEEEIIGKIISIERKVVIIELPDEPGKQYRIHSSELQRATYENGKTIYFFEKYPDIVTKMKKSTPSRDMIEFGPLGPVFNHFYVGYERLYSKKSTYEVQAGVIAPMVMPWPGKMKGFNVNFAWKSIFSEPVRISGLSVRPKMQGAYIGFQASFNMIWFNQNVVMPTDTSLLYYSPVLTRINVFYPTLHVVFGYNKMVAPSVMLGFCGGLGGGPMIIMNRNEDVRNQASLPDYPIGGQRTVTRPFSLLAMITCGILIR